MFNKNTFSLSALCLLLLTPALFLAADTDKALSMHVDLLKMAKMAQSTWDATRGPNVQPPVRDAVNAEPAQNNVAHNQEPENQNEPQPVEIKEDPTKDKSHFYVESYKLQTRINAILHPVLHGCAEKQESFWSEASKTAYDTKDALTKGDFSGAWEKAKSNGSVWQSLKTVVGGVVGKYAGKQAEQVLFHGGFYNESGGSSSAHSGSMSLEALNAAEEDIKKKFPDWDEKKQCPQGVLSCLKLGHNSKAILTSMYAFFDNIKTYEERTGHDFFTQEEANRTFIFLTNVATRICEENILFAATNKNSSAPNDIQLKPYLKVMNYLVAVPTEFHDVSDHWKKNSTEIDELLSFLPLGQRRQMYTYMQKLRGRARDPHYGQQDGDSSINLLLSGETGTGKTFVGKKIPLLLGFFPIIMTFEELRRGQETSFNELEDLVCDDAEISGMETNVLRLDKQKKKGRAPLNPIVFVDELDEDRNYSISELKEQFDQFKKMYFPSLGLTVPGFMNCIFTTNNKSLLKEPALISRFTDVAFPRMIKDKKTAILLKSLQSKLNQFPELKEEFGGGYFDTLVHKAVGFDGRINIRILIDNVDSIIYHVETKQQVKSGEAWFVPVEDRTGKGESYDEFLQRTFGGLNLPDHSDSDSDEEEDVYVESSTPIGYQEPQYPSISGITERRLSFQPSAPTSKQP